MDELLRLQRKMANTYANIIDRCHNPDCATYYWYGARGIEMCERWQRSPDAFIEDMGLPPTAQHSIDRINHNGNYEPSNCRWATQEEQNNNTRRSKLIDWNGKTQSIRDWAKEYNVGGRRLSERLNRGWSMERALNTPCPQGFDGELARRKDYGNALYAINGKIYQARSKKRRGQQLSAKEQELIAIHGADPPEREQAVSPEIVQKIVAMKHSGTTVRKIAESTGVPKSTVHVIIAREKRAQPAS
jgi:hypothetical protein